MTGGLGFTTLMKSLSRTNRSFLKHRDKLNSKKDNLTYLTDRNELKFKEISEKDLEKFKDKLRHERRLEQRKQLVILFILLMIFIAVSLIVYIIVKK